MYRRCRGVGLARVCGRPEEAAMDCVSRFDDGVAFRAGIGAAERSSRRSAARWRRRRRRPRRSAAPWPKPISATPTSISNAPRCACPDENIPKANAGYLPTVSAEGDAALSNTCATGLGPGTAGTIDQTPGRAATASPSRKTSGTATEPSTRCARPNPACWARANNCATPSRTCCSARSPITWTSCATRRSWISTATTSRSCRSSFARRKIVSTSAKSRAPTWRRPRRAWPARRRRR